MLYNQPFDQTNPSASYVDGNPSAGVQGSIPRAAAIEHDQREIVAVIAAAQARGLDAPSASDLQQLLKAARSGLLNRYEATGTPDAIVIVPDPAFTTLVKGLRFRLEVPGGSSVASTTTTPTLKINGFTQLIRLSSGVAPAVGDLKGGAVREFELDASLNARFVGPAPSEISTTPPAPAPVSQVHYGTASGMSPYTVSDLNPPISALSEGMLIILAFPNGVTDGASAIIKAADAVTTVATVALARNDGSNVVAGDIPATGRPVFKTYASANALRLDGFARGEVQRITINPVLYVRLNGNDNNNGLTNTDAGAFATIARALSIGTSAYNFASSTLTIQLGTPGTYAAPQMVPRGVGAINIVGDPNNQANYVLTGAGQPGQGVVQSVATVNLTGLTVQCTSNNAHGVAAGGPGAGGLLSYVTIAMTQTTSGAHIFGVGYGGFTVGPGCILQGNAQAALWGDGGSVSLSTGVTLSVQGTPTFSTAFALFTNQGRIAAQGGSSVSGSASGKRYQGLNLSLATTNGGGANFFPGTTAGTVDPTSVYA